MKFKYRNQILAVFYTLSLSLSHMASATLITVEADVLANTGSSVTFAQFDQSLGTLTRAHLTYSFTAIYNFFNDGDAIEANDWNSNAHIQRLYQRGIRIYTSTETHDRIASRGFDTKSQAWVRLDGTAEEILEDIVSNTYTNTISWETGRIDVPFLGDSLIIDPRDPFDGFTASASMMYTYEAVRAGGPSPVPTPPTLALFTLGLMGLAARRFKKKS
jgi:hypothetical protein